MTDVDAPERAEEAKRAELVEKFNKLADKEDGILEIGDILSNELKHGSLPFPQYGVSIGLNYNEDEYFVDLANGKVLNYSIGGSASTYIEQSRIMTKEDADQTRTAIDLSEKISEIANKAAEGSALDRKSAKTSLGYLEGQIDIIKNFLEDRIREDEVENVSQKYEEDEDDSEGHGFDTPWFKRIKQQEIQDQIDNKKEERNRKLAENETTDNETLDQNKPMSDKDKREEELMEQQMEEENPSISTNVDKKEQIRDMYDNPEDRAAYRNAKATDQFSGTWEEWMFGKENEDEQR